MRQFDEMLVRMVQDLATLPFIPLDENDCDGEKRLFCTFKSLKGRSVGER